MNPEVDYWKRRFEELEKRTIQESRDRMLSFFGLPPGTVCDRCGSPDHITGLGACPAYKIGHCFYCRRDDIEVRENGAYYGCRECVGDLKG